MLKIFILLLAFCPVICVSAEQINRGPTNKKIGSTQKSDTQLRNKNTIDTPRSNEYFFTQCYINVPPITKETNSLPNNQIPVHINAKKIHGIANTITYQDDVKLKQGIKYLASDKLIYFKEKQKAIAEGNVNFINGSVTLYSDSITTQFDNDQSTLQQANYQFHGRGGRGNAENIYDNGLNLYEFKDSSYSACPPQDNTWTLESTTLYLDKNTDVGSAYNAVLKIKDIPVFYFPYVTYPLSNKRKTGLLFPSFDLQKTNGLTITQPLYINISENMDATLTPTNMPHRGILLAAEYRYLFDVGSGKMQAEYLANDKLRDDTRYLYHWNHNVSFSKNWNLTTDYSKVSDDDYFSDITTAYGTRSDSQLLQTAKLSYRKENWNSELEVRDFQILTNVENTPYRLMPKLAFSAYHPLNWKSLQLDWYSEISKFEHNDPNVYTGTRVHLQPKLSLPLYYNALFINTELKYMLSFYNQTLPDNDDYDYLDNNARRYIPSFKIHSGINFERDFSVFDNKYRQTLVPQIQYLYVPYKNQSNIGLYDTTTMQQDYYALFRDNRFSGYDRIADANQITLGISSSFINAQGQEKMRMAIGQNYYFTPSQTQLLQDSSASSTASRSSIIGEFDTNFTNEYFFHAGLEWDSDKKKLTRGNAAFEKRWLYNTYAQLNYRYIAVPDDGEKDQLVNQLGSKISWSINSQWHAFSSYYYDVKYKHPYESITGIKYQSCCWAIGLTYDDHMLSYSGDQDLVTENRKTEQSYKINFELTGLGGVGFNSSEQGLFNYGRPFYLQ